MLHHLPEILHKLRPLFIAWLWVSSSACLICIVAGLIAGNRNPRRRWDD